MFDLCRAQELAILGPLRLRSQRCGHGIRCRTRHLAGNSPAAQGLDGAFAPPNMRRIENQDQMPTRTGGPSKAQDELTSGLNRGRVKLSFGVNLGDSDPTRIEEKRKIRHYGSLAGTWRKLSQSERSIPGPESMESRRIEFERSKAVRWEIWGGPPPVPASDWSRDPSFAGGARAAAVGIPPVLIFAKGNVSSDCPFKSRVPLPIPPRSNPSDDPSGEFA